MVKIEKIAETISESNNKIEKDPFVLSGMFAGVCYAKDGYKTIKEQSIEKAVNRASSTAASGHHSVFGHTFITMEIECPKIIAMLLNSIGVSNTSEKSARYTVMKPQSEDEKRLYNKWHDIFIKLINDTNASKSMTEKEIDKIAWENARYMISVFTSTSMVYTLPYRNIFYVMDWADNMYKNIYSNPNIKNKFNIMLADELYDLIKCLMNIVGNENKQKITDNKNEYFRFLPVQAIGEEDFKSEYYGDVYTSRYLASFAEIAQAERHRTTRTAINFIGDYSEQYGFYIPELIKNTNNQKLINEWMNDIESLKNIYPQGTLLDITEQGLFEDFCLKCKERMCGRAQLEIMRITEKQILSFVENKNNLSKLNRERLDNLLKDGKPCARCQYKDFTCKEGCHWGPKSALIRKF